MSSKPTFKDIEKLLKAGEFAVGTPMALATSVARKLILGEALSVVDAGHEIAIQSKNGAVVRYVWNHEIRGWQATI